MPRFGVAGNPPAFFESAYGRDRLNAPRWLAEIGLDAIEVQCTRGVRMSSERAAAYRAVAADCGIEVSIHGPYFISLGNPDPAVGENSLRELQKCVSLAKALGARRIVFHPGSAGNEPRAALERAIALLMRFERECDLDGIWLCPEITGKRRQLGSLADVLAIAREIRSARPCLDLAHHHARTGGSLNSQQDVADVLDAVEAAIGVGALSECHYHFYPIEWGPGGEVRHRAFDDIMSEGGCALWPPASCELFAPRPEPFIAELVRRGLRPLVICEAKDSQERGATIMKQLWREMRGVVGVDY
ncbi:hypothetical protein PHYC_01552 [Phycisphaerales bacterium]|nr:hypothetical protein PHYC_01552 [Phycisphaerales bacterium]